MERFFRFFCFFFFFELRAACSPLLWKSNLLLTLTPNSNFAKQEWKWAFTSKKERRRELVFFSPQRTRFIAFTLFSKAFFSAVSRRTRPTSTLYEHRNVRLSTRMSGRCRIEEESTYNRFVSLLRANRIRMVRTIIFCAIIFLLTTFSTYPSCQDSQSAVILLSLRLSKQSA